MTIFEEISVTKGKIEKVKDKLEYLQMKIDSPRSCVISDMPRGGGNAGNPLEQYVEKKEELMGKLARLERTLERQWIKARSLMDAANIDDQTQVMMYYRFDCGLQWEKVALALTKKYPQNRWNVNKCFRKYREVICRTRKL